MAKIPEEIIAMSDHQLMMWTLSGQEVSYVYRIGETTMAMRASAQDGGGNRWDGGSDERASYTYKAIGLRYVGVSDNHLPHSACLDLACLSELN